MNNGEKVEVKVIPYAHLKGICGFASAPLFVPVDCAEAFPYVWEWLRENYGIDHTKALLLYNDAGANRKTFAGQRVKSGDVFKLIPAMSGG